MAREYPSTRYEDFVAAVRRHAPSDLLPALAIESVKRFTGGGYQAPRRELLYPWVIAAAARESIAYGNDYRSAPVDERALARMRNHYVNLHDPFLDTLGEDGALDSMLVRMAFEQFPCQHSRFEDMARLLLLFDRDYTGLGCKTLSGTAWEQALGMPFKQFMRAAFLILVGGQTNAGWFDPAWMHQPNFGPVFERMDLTSDVVLGVFDQVFAADFANVKARARVNRHIDPLLRRYDANPLMETPYVRMADGRYLAPDIFSAAQRLSPASLYYVGLSQWGPAFTDDLGAVTERYVGEQLDLVDTQLVLHDVPYAKGDRAADYVVALRHLTLVIEVKSARVARPGRLDRDGYLADLNKDVGKALTPDRSNDQAHPGSKRRLRPDRPDPADSGNRRYG